jgi:hypothetical protein
MRPCQKKSLTRLSEAAARARINVIVGRGLHEAKCLATTYENVTHLVDPDF